MASPYCENASLPPPITFPFPPYYPTNDSTLRSFFQPTTLYAMPLSSSLVMRSPVSVSETAVAMPPNSAWPSARIRFLKTVPSVRYSTILGHLTSYDRSHATDADVRSPALAFGQMVLEISGYLVQACVVRTDGRTASKHSRAPRPAFLHTHTDTISTTIPTIRPPSPSPSHPSIHPYNHPSRVIIPVAPIPSQSHVRACPRT